MPSETASSPTRIPRSSDGRQPVDVAVAVLMRPDGCVLLARRPAGKVYAGYWEFPGGKVEDGEPVADALRRELQEELDIRVERAYPWITQVFTYPHAMVRLHFYRVVSWNGALRATEHSELSWERAGSVRVSPLLPANAPILRALALPQEYAISQAAELGVEVFLARLRARVAAGLGLVQVREPTYSVAQVGDLVARIIAIARLHGARVLVNSDVGLALRSGADGVHLTARQVAEMDRRPDVGIVGASCHSSGELRAAEGLGADFAVLGPVRFTQSHPEREPLGWDGFGETCRGAALPVYALGGVSSGDMLTACGCGAHGIAMVRGAWSVG